jgi:hypothetical protein
LEFYTALFRSSSQLVDLANFSPVMSPRLMDARARLLIQLCHTRPLDFADLTVPDNALNGALEHLLNTNHYCAHSVLLATGPGDKRELVEEIGRTGLLDGPLDEEDGRRCNRLTGKADGRTRLMGQSCCNRAMDCGEAS